MFLSFIVYEAKPSLTDAFHLLRDKSSHWHDIGRDLEVSINYRKSLRTLTESDDVKLEDILNRWLESECSEVSWNHLIEVLEELKFRDIIHDIQKFLGTDKAIKKYSSKGIVNNK